MAEGAVFGILGKIGEYLVAPIGQQFRYICCYNNMIENLRDQVQDLDNTRAGEQLRVDAAKRNVEVINPVVEAWLINVEEIKIQSAKILEDKAIVENGCLNGWFPNLKSRYLVGRKLMKKTREVVELKGLGKFDWVSCPSAPSMSKMMPPISIIGSCRFDSRVSTMNEIIAALKNFEVNLIGICGMGGVGKTTMAHEVRERAIGENLFDEVVMILVSQNQDIFKIQGKLGAVLGLRFDEGTDVLARANRLGTRLQNGKRILVILDDVWEGLDLGHVGVPLNKGCKVLLTSRIEDVCIEMGTQKKDVFTVHVLPNQEAWILFKGKAGNCVDATDLRSIAEEVAKECSGLPIAIVNVAKALKDKDKHVWSDALHQLRKSSVQHIRGMHKKVFSCIELSYEYLESDQAKSLFLLCCVFPEDHEIPIEILVRYVVGLELFQDVDMLAATRNRVCSLVGQLRSSHLLLDEARFEDQYVKMHDVVRDVGIFLASGKGEVYKVLKEWLQNDTHEPYTALSILTREMLEVPADQHFPKLKLLQLECILNRQELGDSFGEMKQLKVIDVRNMRVKSLAQTLRFSINLRTLCLDSCKVSNDLSFIGCLRHLEILTFFLSELEVLPSEIGQLSNLKMLDLRCFVGPSMIPSGVFLGLKKLEELYMGYYFVGNNIEEHNKRNCASFTELNLLADLTTLQIKIPQDPEHLRKLKDFHFENLVGFDFEMRDNPPFIGYQFSNKVSLSEVDVSVVLKSNIRVLVRRAEVLDLRGVRGFRNVVKDLDEEGFLSLKALYVKNCDEVEYVIDAVDSVPTGFFGKLQKLTLYSLPGMKHLWRGPIQPPSLGNLRDVEICECNAIKSIFCQRVVKCLVQLQSLAIVDCEMLEEVVSRKDNEMIEFTKLEELYLKKLPNLSSFYSDGGITQTLLNQQVILPNLEDLELTHLNAIQIVGVQMQAGSLDKLRTMTIEHCKNLLNIAASDQIALFENLQRLSLAHCDSLEAVFNFEGLKLTEETTKLKVSSLESMKLSHLPKLTCIWRMVPKEIQCFQTLRSLIVENCNSLRYLLSPFMAELLVNLEDLFIKKCEMMEEIIIDQEGQEMDIVIMFRKLRTLRLEGLNSLTSFNIGKRAFEFPSLEELVIKNCHSMKFFCSESINAPKLRGVMVGDDQFVLMGDLNDIIKGISGRCF